MDCQIRKWNMADKACLSAMLNNKKILDNLRDGLPYPYTLADAEAFIAAMLAADQNKIFPFAIAIHDRAVGSICGFRRNNIYAHSAEIGYYIDESYWGQGLATSAIRQICQFIFQTTDIIRIFAETFANNSASCRALEKAGFQWEGTLHSAACKNGKLLDIKIYAALHPSRLKF